MTASYAAINPASLILFTDFFTEDLVQAVQRLPSVREAEGRRSIMTQFKLAGEEKTFPIELIIFENYEDIRIGKVYPEKEWQPDRASWPQPDTWPPPKNGVLLERTSLLPAHLGLVRAKQGDKILVKTSLGKERELELAGLTYDFGRMPASHAGRAYGYITFDTAERLGEPRKFNELHIIVSGNRYDKTRVKQVAQEVERWLERGGYRVYRIETPEPDKLPLDSQFQTLSMVLAVIGALSLLLSGFLIVNTVSALLTEQIREIGMIKAVGGRSIQIITMYLGMTFILGLLALIIAFPIGLWLANGFSLFLSLFLNFTYDQFRIPFPIVGVYAAIALGAPPLIAALPIIAGSRITVREAIHHYGVSENRFGTSIVDRLVERIRNLPRPFLLGVRNAARRKTRLILTMTPLVLAGILFIAVLSVYSSLLLTLENTIAFWNYDLQVQFNRSYQIERIDRIIDSMPEIAATEYWASDIVYRVRSDESESSPITIVAPPIESKMIRPSVIRGRWLLPQDENALVINTILQKEEPDIQLGDEITLKIKGRETNWRVVGVIQEGMTGGTMLAYANYPYFTRITREPRRASSLQIIISERDVQLQNEMADALQQRFEASGLDVASIYTIEQVRVASKVYFEMIISFFLALAIALAIIGGLGLMGAMSINVLERTREIGILRAIGASNETVQHIFITESITIGIICWFLSIPVAYPLSRALNRVIGTQLLNGSLDDTFSFKGVIIWFILSVTLATLATILPARQAARLDIPKALAHE
ncbi:MAG: ABC transporter permease [Chloroflexi bacterium]|nr:ABC transporter permease [Chloroflexota bacterium]